MAHKIGEVFGVDYRKFIERGDLGRYRPSPNKKGRLLIKETAFTFSRGRTRTSDLRVMSQS
jgi:hypothetical protein